VTHSQSEAFAMADRIVIMSKGEIAQIGTAREIYRAPVSRFVAEFVGRNNIFTGTSQGGGIITTAFGALTVGGERAKGTSVSFSVAADLMSVSATPPATNSIEAQLLSEEFVGSMVTLFFEAKDGTELKVQMPERSFAALPLDTSRSVYLNFAPENAQLLKD